MKSAACLNDLTCESWLSHSKLRTHTVEAILEKAKRALDYSSQLGMTSKSICIRV